MIFSRQNKIITFISTLFWNILNPFCSWDLDPMKCTASVSKCTASTSYIWLSIFLKELIWISGLSGPSSSDIYVPISYWKNRKNLGTFATFGSDIYVSIFFLINLFDLKKKFVWISGPSGPPRSLGPHIYLSRSD